MDDRRKKAPKKTPAKKVPVAKLNGRPVRQNGKKRSPRPKAKLVVSHTNGTAIVAQPTVFDAVSDGFEAVLDAVQAANDRSYRVSRALVDQARDVQRDALEFTKLWAEAPLDRFGFASAVIDVTTNGHVRALRGASQWFEELSLAQEEANHTIRRVARANRSAGEAVVEGTRGFLAQAADLVCAAR